jgi:hypothetical protein
MPRRHGARNGVTCVTNLGKTAPRELGDEPARCMEKWTPLSRDTDATEVKSRRECLLSRCSGGPLRAYSAADE